MHVIYRYFAVKPIKAEHPIGSGEIVEFPPGAEIPGSDWGRAIHNLVELGKAARVAFNVPDDEDYIENITIGVPTVQNKDDSASHVTRDKKKPGRPKKP